MLEKTDGTVLRAGPVTHRLESRNMVAGGPELGTPINMNQPANARPNPPAPPPALHRPPSGSEPATAGAARPAALPAGSTEFLLPGVASDAVVGGGGKYLMISLPRQRKLAIFDIPARKVVRYVDLREDGALVAAGMDKLIVGLPGQNQLERWDLKKLEKEVTVAAPSQGKMAGLYMGSASTGPLLMVMDDGGFRGRAEVIDPMTWQPLKFTKPRNGLGIDARNFVRVSANGKVFTDMRPGSSPQGISVYSWAGKELKQSYAHDSAGHLDPDPSGRFIYTGRGVFSTEAKRIGEPVGNKEVYCLPALQGDLFIIVTPGNREAGGEGKEGPGTLSLHVNGDMRPLLTVPDFPLPAGINGWDREKFGTDKRIFFAPEYKVIVTIPVANDRLVLTSFDIEKKLKESGIDYLFVASQPPGSPARGAAFTYAIDVKSKKGGVKYQLEFGPQGMEISPNGKLSWKIPADWAEAETDVAVRISDDSGQQCLHSFKIQAK